MQKACRDLAISNFIFLFFVIALEAFGQTKGPLYTAIASGALFATFNVWLAAHVIISALKNKDKEN